METQYKEFKERISYETLLLTQINNCVTRRYAYLRPPGGSPFEFIVCVRSLRNILTKELREDLKKRLESDKEYQKLKEELENAYDKEEVDILFRMSTIVLRTIIDVLNDHGLLLREREIYRGEA